MRLRFGGSSTCESRADSAACAGGLVKATNHPGVSSIYSEDISHTLVTDGTDSSPDLSYLCSSLHVIKALQWALQHPITV